MTKLDDLDTRVSPRRPSHPFALLDTPHAAVAGPMRTASLAGEAPRAVRPGRLQAMAAIFSTIGSTGFTNPGEQIRAWTLWLSVINVAMAVALGLSLYAVLR
ncbi:hypothetical protein [Microbacterium sp. BK668]|uniref:hypothetical protein n=1 Tax=Microbacterium sp. BK668 TaxID=2512118 RepID=UPI0010607A3D|nr:hypothetical protein [Microbacterium sp. BK668]TDN91401.1 hypothetical protein EV279_0900 [Microbacterium sp. BK668]